MATTIANDVISSRMAKCYVVIGGNRYEAANALKLEAKFDVQKQDVPCLGSMNTPQRITGYKGSGSATFYNVSSRFARLIIDHQKGGAIPYFEIETVNEDPQSSAGRQSVILKNCLLDSVVLASFDGSGDFLRQEMNFTFETAEMPEEFGGVAGAV